MGKHAVGLIRYLECISVGGLVGADHRVGNEVKAEFLGRSIRTEKLGEICLRGGSKIDVADERVVDILIDCDRGYSGTAALEYETARVFGIV